MNWLEETEEVVANQKQPSADPKVVKAFIQAHEFYMKLVNDKRANVEGFEQMAQRLEPSSESQNEYVQTTVEGIVERYACLCEVVNSRQQQLQLAMALTQEWHNLHTSLGQFLDKIEREMHLFDSIPTDSQRLEEQVALQASLQTQLDEKRSEFDRLGELFADLRSVVDVDDALELEASIRRLTSRYNELGLKCQNYGKLIGDLAEDIELFLESTNQLAEWLDEAEKGIARFGEVGIHPDELDQQSEELSVSYFFVPS